MSEEPTNGKPLIKKAVLICVPAYKMVEPATTRFVAELCAYTAQLRNDVIVGVDVLDSFPTATCKHCHNEGSNYADARNQFVAKALEKGFTHLCMIDSDMDRSLKQEHSYKMLASLLDADRDIIGPLFMRRSFPFDLLARRYDSSTGLRRPITADEAISGKIIDDIQELGTGMMLINCRVLKDMDSPWFAFEIFKGEPLPEDVNFCRKARQKGFKISVHTGWHLDHIGPHRYTPQAAIEVQQYALDKEAQGILDELHKEKVAEVV